MTTLSSLGRRERNKLAKLARIMAAAGELFAEHGIDDVTTQQIAAAADIATGTLFLYAKTKGELLLLVQNARYRTALTSASRTRHGDEPRRCRHGHPRARHRVQSAAGRERPRVPPRDCLRRRGRAPSRRCHRHRARHRVGRRLRSSDGWCRRRHGGRHGHLVDGAMLLALAGAGQASDAEIGAQCAPVSPYCSTRGSGPELSGKARTPVRRNRLRHRSLVGVTGFEPAASSSRTKRATKLRHTPWESPPTPVRREQRQ